MTDDDENLIVVCSRRTDGVSRACILSTFTQVSQVYGVDVKFNIICVRILPYFPTFRTRVSTALRYV